MFRKQCTSGSHYKDSFQFYRVLSHCDSSTWSKNYKKKNKSF